MSGREINTVWQRIEAHAGNEFHLTRGAPFRYTVAGGHVLPDRTNQQIPKSHFEKGLTLVPLADTTLIQDLRGPSYIYAILGDPRIRQSYW